jgi:hypothetical protein
MTYDLSRTTSSRYHMNLNHKLTLRKYRFPRQQPPVGQGSLIVEV